jgi:hypothetical protein
LKEEKASLLSGIGYFANSSGLLTVKLN